MLEPQIFFGQLQHIFATRLQASLALGLQQQTTLILATIWTCSNPQLIGENGTYYYSQEGPLEVVDIKCVKCLVGWVKDGNEWVIVDHSGSCAHPVL